MNILCFLSFFFLYIFGYLLWYGFILTNFLTMLAKLVDQKCPLVYLFRVNIYFKVFVIEKFANNIGVFKFSRQKSSEILVLS